MTNNWIYRLSYKVAKIKHSEVVWEPRPVYVFVCVYGPPVLGFGVLMGLSISVHVHGPTVLGFDGFHSFDGPVHLCLCVYLDHQFWVLAVFTVLMGLSICVHVHGPTVLGFGGFHQWF